MFIGMFMMPRGSRSNSRRESLISVPVTTDVSVVGCKMVLAKLRVQHGPLVAILVEGHHSVIMRMLYIHAACGRSRVPGVG